MVDAGWVEIVVMSEDLFVDAWRLLERIRRVLAERRLPGVPAQVRREWREAVI